MQINKEEWNWALKPMIENDWQIFTDIILFQFSLFDASLKFWGKKITNSKQGEALNKKKKEKNFLKTRSDNLFIYY